MAAPVKPGKKPALGRDAWWMIPTLTTSGPLATEVNASGGLNITCFLLGEQEDPGSDTPKITLPRLLCETTTSEGLDVTKVTLPTFRFAWDPQAAANANDKKAWALMKDGFSGYAARRQNVVAAAEANSTAGQFIDWFAITGSVGIPKKSATDASGIYVFDVDFASTDFKFNVALG